MLELHTPMGPGFFIFFQDIAGGGPKRKPDKFVFLEPEKDWVDEEIEEVLAPKVKRKTLKLESLSATDNLDDEIRAEFEVTEEIKRARKRRVRKAMDMILRSL